MVATGSKLSDESLVVAGEGEPGDVDDPAALGLEALAVVLLEDALDVAHGVVAVLLHGDHGRLADVDGAALLLLAVLGHPPLVLHRHLLLEELPVDVVQLVRPLPPPLRLHVHAALEVLELVLLLFLLLELLLLHGGLLVLVGLQLRQDQLRHLVVRGLLLPARHVQRSPQTDDLLRDLLRVFVVGRSLLVDLHEFPLGPPRVDVQRGHLRIVAQLLPHSSVGLVVLEVVLLLQDDVFYLLAFDFEGKILFELQLLWLGVVLQSLGFVHNLQWLNLVLDGVVAVDDLNEFVDGLFVLDVLDLLHVPVDLQQGGDFEHEQADVGLVPEFDQPILGNGEGCQNLQLQLRADRNLFVVHLLQQVVSTSQFDLIIG